MYKKNILIIICFLLVSVIGYFFYNKIKQNDEVERFYLENKYYNNGVFVDVNNTSLEKVKNENFILFTYNNYCSMAKPCEEVFEEFMKKYKINFLSIPFEDFKNTDFYKTVKYAPSIIVVEKGKVVGYLDAESNDDLNKYQDMKEFESWLNNYIYFSK